MSITPRKLKDGTTVYDVRVSLGYTRDGKVDRRSVTVKTKRAAQLEESKMIAERDARRGRSGKMTLAQYIDGYYWPIAKGRLAATSLDTYKREIDKRIKPHLGNCDIRDIDRQRIQRMLDTVRSSDVARKTLGTLKTILNEAVGDGLIVSNPATAKYSMPPKGRKRDNGLVLTTFEQINDFAAIVRQSAPQRLIRVVMLGLYQGLRPEERYAIDWSDIDTISRTIAINSAYVEAPKEFGGVQPKPTKTEMSTRVIPMHPTFAAWVVDIPRTDGAFIKGVHGERICPSTARKQWTRYLAAHPELPPVTIENMRHSFATAYLDAGGRIEVLSKLLGHSNINTTINRYYKPDVNTLRNDIFSGNF